MFRRYFFFFFFFCVPQLDIWASPILVRFLRMWPFLNPTSVVVTFRLRGWCLPSVFFCCRHSPVMGMNVRIFRVRAMERMYVQIRSRFILSSKRVYSGMESEPILTPRKKNPLYRRLRGESNPRRYITQDSEPNALPTELFRPRSEGIRQVTASVNLCPTGTRRVVVKGTCWSKGAR